MQNTFGFADHVLREFSFLVDHGKFVVTYVTPTLVEFSTSYCSISVFCDVERSREIDISISPADQVKDAGNLGSLLEVINPKSKSKIGPIGAEVNGRDVADRVSRLARDFQTYVDLTLLNQADLFDRLLELSNRKAIELGYMRAGAIDLIGVFRALWNAGQFRELIEQFRAMEQYLPPQEREQLAFAESHLRNQDKPST